MILIVTVAAFGWCGRRALADSRGDELAHWINQRGEQFWGPPPPTCDDLTFARRVYLDVIGRVPSVSELHDFQALGENKRSQLIDQLVFAEGPRADTYKRLTAAVLARQWRRVFLPPGTTASGPPELVETWLQQEFSKRTALNEVIGELVRLPTPTSAGNYYSLVGSLPENYAGHLSRAALGVRIECAQCHDHPFSNWKQNDFWGLAAFYSDMPRPGADAASKAATVGSIEYENVTYSAKLLWQKEGTDSEQTDATQTRVQLIDDRPSVLRDRLADWLTSKDNPNFSATAVNRFWQHYVGRGLYADVENLDRATEQERAMLDELGDRFADAGFNVQWLIAGIAKSSWYQAQSVAADADVELSKFTRALKMISPEQVFDSLEQSLLLPVSRIDPSSSRWTGDRMQLVSRLSETIGATPEDYAAGIPQALLLMNGKMTSDAIDPDRSRLLRAVLEAPFIAEPDKINTLYLAVLTREPTREEASMLTDFLQSQSTPASQTRAYGEVLWALLNSPEFVLCR